MRYTNPSMFCIAYSALDWNIYIAKLISTLYKEINKKEPETLFKHLQTILFEVQDAAKYVNCSITLATIVIINRTTNY